MANLASKTLAYWTVSTAFRRPAEQLVTLSDALEALHAITDNTDPHKLVSLCSSQLRTEISGYGDPKKEIK